MNRREFLRTLGRISALSVLGLGAGIITSKGLGGPLPEQTCISNQICRNCTRVKACALPQALSYKQVQKGIKPNDR